MAGCRSKLSVLPYWVLFSMFVLGALQYSVGHTPGRRRTDAFLFRTAGILAVLLIGLRFKVGGDWNTYIIIYDAIALSDFFTGVIIQEPGYSLLNMLAWELGADVWFVNLACGGILIWGLLRFAKVQPNPWLCVVVAVPYLVIVIGMGYTRQSVAIGLILAGLVTLERSMIKFFLFVLAAAMFHRSAVLVIPLVGLAAAQNRLVVFGLLGLLMLGLYLTLAGSADRLVTNYVTSGYAAQGAMIRVAMNLPPALLFLAWPKHFARSVQEIKVWRNFAIAAIALLAILLFTSATVAVDRTALYIIPLQLFVFSRLPNAFSADGKSNGQIALLVIAYSALIQFVWLNFALFSALWIPYEVFPIGEPVVSRWMSPRL